MAQSTTLAEHFAALATADPDAPAITCAGSTVTRRQLEHRTNRLARAYARSHGCRPTVLRADHPRGCRRTVPDVNHFTITLSEIGARAIAEALQDLRPEPPPA